jgi:hypothetical protein
MLPVVERMKAEAHTDKEIFKELQISKTTFYNLLNKNTDFKNAYDKGKKQTKPYLESLTESAVKKLLTGVETTETTTKFRTNKDGEKVLAEQTVKHKTAEPNAYLVSTLVKIGVGGLGKEADDDKIREVIINLNKYKKVSNEELDNDK